MDLTCKKIDGVCVFSLNLQQVLARQNCTFGAAKRYEKEDGFAKPLAC